MAEQPCIIGNNIFIRGNLSGDEDLIVEGKIEGTIKLSHHLTIEPPGFLEAELEVEDVTVNGTIQGDITASNTVLINPGAKVIGTIRAPRIIIEDGAQFKGRIDMDFELPEELSNLNSRS